MITKQLRNKKLYYSSLKDFIKILEEKGDLVRITEPVSTHLEMTEIHRRVIKNGGPAILFENVITDKDGGKSSMPVLVNLFGTVKRVAMGMGVENHDELRSIGEMLAFLRQPEPPEGLKDAIKMLPVLKQVMAMKSKTVSKAPCQDIVLTGDDVDLNTLPIQTCWPNDAAPLISWPLVVTKGADDGDEKYNLGVYRMQVTGRNTTLMRWLRHRGGAQHWREWSKKKEPIPVAVVIGADPATILAAVTPVPDTLSEYDFSGFLRKKKLKLVECKTIPVKVPANAEIVLEGHVSFDEMGEEGPFGDHTGYYNSKEKFPIFTVSAITMQKNPIYLSTFTGRPPDEPSVLAEALNEVFIPLISQQFPEITDFWLPPEGCSYRIAVVSIKKEYAGHAKRIMMGVWSYLRQFTYTKFVIIVDEDINCRDWKDVMWAISTRMDFVRDTVIVENTPIDYLDFASQEAGLGSKMGFDATNKIPPETKREWGKEITMSDDVMEKITENWSKYGL